MGRISVPKAAAGLVAGVTAFGVAGFAVAQGGLTANLALSGTFFNVNVRHLEGEGFSLFVDSDKKGEEDVPTARLKLDHAVASDLCLYVTTDLPAVGEATLALMAKGDNSVEATDLLVGASDIEGSLKMQDANVGIDANQLSDTADPGTWGLYAKQVSLTADDIRATSLGAKTLSAQNVGVTVERGRSSGC